MQRRIMILGVGALLMTGAAVHALTSLMPVTPKNLKEARFTITSKPAPNDAVEFTIRRDIRGISLPGRVAYIWDSTREQKSLGTRLKLEEDKDKTLTFRFSVPKSRVADTRFTLWGNGLAGEGVTFELRLADFWEPKKD